MNDDRPVVLIVDDQPVNLKLLADVLQPDFQVKVAANGPDALDLAGREPPPEVILLDVMMPVAVRFAVEDQGIGVAFRVPLGIAGEMLDAP